MATPRHEHRCLQEGCGRISVTDRIDARCKGCGSVMALVGSAGTPNFKSFWHPNLGHEPVKISSSKELDRELNKRGMFVNETKVGDKVRLPRTKKEALNV